MYFKLLFISLLFALTVFSDEVNEKMLQELKNINNQHINFYVGKYDCIPGTVRETDEFTICKTPQINSENFELVKIISKTDQQIEFTADMIAGNNIEYVQFFENGSTLYRKNGSIYVLIGKKKK